MSELISEARMLAALSATNEAVLRAHSSAELFQRVCEAAVEGGGLCLAAALLPDHDRFLRLVAQASHVGDTLDAVISIDAGRDDGQGLAGGAFRNGRTQISNDSFNDDRLKHWRQLMIDRGQRLDWFESPESARCSSLSHSSALSRMLCIAAIS